MILCDKNILPKFMHRPAYRSLKNFLRIHTYKNLPRFTADPFVVFIELKLDEVFRQEGLPGVKKAIIAWFNEHRKNIKKIIPKETI